VATHIRRAARGIKEDNPVAFFYAQDVRYIAREHMDVRRDCFSIALLIHERYAAGAGMRTTAGMQEIE